MTGSAILRQGPAGIDPDRETLQGAAAIAISQSTARTEGGSGTRVRDVATSSGHRGTLSFPNTHITRENHRFGSPVSPHPVSCIRL